ncbi:MAG: UDP-N-acetylmuramoyl-L-alanine--D-glutamate ligase [Candidatus Limnocylindria bacterium]
MMAAPPRAIRTLADLRGRHALVLGLARSGVAASRFLADAGADVTAYDRRSADELTDGVAELEGRPVRLALGVPEGEARALIEATDLLVTSPSVSARFPTTDPWLREALLAAEARGAEIVSEVDLFLRLTRAKILGVTGTKGKTTTSSLVAAMLERAGISHVLGGNIGTPLVEQSTTLGPEDWAVVELSELQLPTISRGADVAVYTNIGEDHLDRHGSVGAYRAVKARLAELSADGGRVILNRDDPGSRDLGSRLPAASIEWYGLEPSAHLAAELSADGWLLVSGERLLPVADVPIPGRHLLADVLASALGARAAGAGLPEIAAAVRDFGGVPHRLELIAEREGVRWINDSQATIPLAAIAALEAFDTPIVLIAGGRHKGLDYHGFADSIAARARGAVLIGETADELDALIGGRVPVFRASSMPEAVALAAELVRPGDVALLAPAAASFDMFEDYAARGDAFRASVAALGDAS